MLLQRDYGHGRFGHVVALDYAEPVLSSRVFDRDLLAVRVRVRVRSGPAPVRPDRFALPQTVVGRERVLKPAVLLERLFVHQYGWQLFVTVAACIVAAVIIRRVVVRTETRGRRYENGD